MNNLVERLEYQLKKLTEESMYAKSSWVDREFYLMENPSANEYMKELKDSGLRAIYLHGIWYFAKADSCLHYDMYKALGSNMGFRRGDTNCFVILPSNRLDLKEMENIWRQAAAGGNREYRKHLAVRTLKLMKDLSSRYHLKIFRNELMLLVKCLMLYSDSSELERYKSKHTPEESRQFRYNNTGRDKYNKKFSSTYNRISSKEAEDFMNDIDLKGIIWK